MLEKLLIKNYLLLKDIDIGFSGGFNVITGETGAGKSILINALTLLLGERADYSIISKNKEKMVVEGLVKKTKNNQKIIEDFLKNNSIEDSEYLIIRRELYTKGYSRSFVNDTPVNVNDLKLLGDGIVDIHSQNEHQSLLEKEIHIELLDSYLKKEAGEKFNKSTENYGKGYNRLKELDSELSSLYNRKTELENKRTFLEFQLKEIKETDPKPNEDAQLEEELKTIENVEVIQQSLAATHSSLYEDSGSVAERLKFIEKELEKIKDFNKEILPLLKDVSSSASVLNEVSRQISGILSTLSYDPVRIEQIRERLYKLQFIKKKYGGSLEEALRLKDELEKDLSLLDNFDERINKVEKEISELKVELFKEASAISKIRKDKSKQLENEVIKVLNEIGFENAEFKVGIETNADEKESNFSVKQKNTFISLGPNGFDDIEFLVKINKGDDFSSLRKTASGGEISRIMLALKAVLADADRVDVLVFDEIDIGISGRIAQKAGRVLKTLSGFHQVISITHLAQIAALADEHFLVEKESGKDTTETRIRRLGKEEKTIEVARLLSGEKVTDAAIKSAKELMKT